MPGSAERRSRPSRKRIGVERKHILVLASSTGGGDRPPLVAVACGLVGRGHSVVCIGDRNLAQDLRSAPLAVEAAPPNLDLSGYIGRWRERVEENLDIAELWVPFTEWVNGILPFVLNRVEAFAPDVVLCNDTTLLLGRALRRRVPAPLCFLNSTFYYGRSSRRRLYHDFAPGGARAFARGLTLLLEEADMALHATDPLFDPPPDPPPRGHQWVGPLFWEPFGEAPAYLHTSGNPWALVTLSSARQEGEVALARTTLSALTDFPLRVLLTLADPNAADDVGIVPRNAHVEAYVPHSLVLERSAVCVSHAGHGIVLKCMWHGIPMVLVPWDRDQPGVAARARALGVARVLARNEFGESALATAVWDVLRNPSYRRRAIDQAQRLRAGDPCEQACRHILQLASYTACA